MATHINPAEAKTAVGIDEGLRAHMLRVYNFMAGGVALTGILAYVVSQSPAMLALVFGNPVIMWTVMLSPFAILLFGFTPGALRKRSTATVQLLFWLFCSLFGLSLSTIFLAYTGESVARVFFISSGTFAATSIWGYSTKRDLTSLGGFLFMGLIGLIIASIVNIFLASSALHWALSVAGVGIFVGLTAYDTQKIKEAYRSYHDSDSAMKLAVAGALNLYLDFINLFIMLMRLLGDRR